MSLSIYPPLGFSFIGERENNEDNQYPALADASEHDRLFLVCDGMGGGATGEVASQLVCDGIARFFSEYEFPLGKSQLGNHDEGENNTSFEQRFVQDAVASVQQEMDAYIRANPLSKGMGSTMSLIYLQHKHHVSSAIVAHIGDSRIYHVRDGKVLWQSEDHKWVNEMVKKGILTPEEATDHPKRNVINRVVQAASQREAIADVQELFDLKPDDYFFMCSDGVIETLTDEKLTEILNTPVSEEEKLAQIKAICENKTDDNASAYLIKIKTAEVATLDSEDLLATEIIPDDDVPVSSPRQFTPEKSPVGQLGNILAMLIMGCLVGWFVYAKVINRPQPNSEMKVVGTTSQTTSLPKPPIK